MRHRLTNYALLLIGIILAVSLASCRGEQESAGLLPAVQWSQTFGYGKNTSGGSVQQTKDGGYILCGITESSGAGGQDAWLIRTDVDGNELWDKTFGGEKDDIAISVQQTVDGGYILCGNTDSYGAGKADIWLIKTDNEGNNLWDKTFGDTGNDKGRSVQQTSDGGYILCGNTDSYGVGKADIWLIKTDADGNKQWDKTFGSREDDVGGSAQQTTDGGYILTGTTISYEANKEYSSRAWLVKTDGDGNKLWEKTFIGEEKTASGSVQQTTDGGYVVCGYSSMDPIGIWASLIRTDANGNKLWEKAFGGRGVAFGYSAQQTSDDGYVMCGIRYLSMGSGTCAWLIKTDTNGDKVWDGEFGKDKWSSGNSIQQTTDGGYIVCGSTSDDMEKGSILLLKIAPEQ